KKAFIMKKTITPGQISQTNLELIYSYIYRNGPVSQQDISYDLRLSRPTVTSKLGDLESAGMIRKEGQIESDLVGRKAYAYTIVPDYRIAIGVELLKRECKIVTVDLNGHYSARKVLPVVFEITEEYHKTVCGFINSYIEDLHFANEKILGIGITVQGLVNTDGTEVTYGKIMNCTGLSIDGFRKYLPYPCRFLHDAAAAAGSELWASPEIPDFVYLNISIHLGAAMICNRKILSGQHGYSATIEHIQIDPNGPPCYCGKRGCTETFCSMSALLMDEEADTFFALMRKGDADRTARWKKYLHYIAIAINNAHLLYDTVFILGGYLAPYFTDEDIENIYNEIEQKSPFPEFRDFIMLSKMPKHSITIGAALPYISEFLSDLS
ncbi:MAG: ROK family transcriptional regulator, partial [Lachnospiraceae bacterium]|nr:ROK family transcriptional regulator [Lachnospiraceae bacterium]